MRRASNGFRGDQGSLREAAEGVATVASFWTGVQLDQTAQPILLADVMLREGGLSSAEQTRFWPMVLKAAQFLTQYGAATELDRWEDKGGYTAYTLSTMIAALLAAAEW